MKILQMKFRKQFMILEKGQFYINSVNKICPKVVVQLI